MKYIKLLKKSLIRNFNESLKFNLISKVFIIGAVLILISGIISELFFEQTGSLLNIFIGFSVSYFLFIDVTLYLFKNLKKLNAIKINLILIKNLLFILFFFIIFSKLIKLNFIFIVAGITIMPVSIGIIWLFFPLNTDKEI